VNTPTRRKKSQICQVTTHVFSKDYSWKASLTTNSSMQIPSSQSFWPSKQNVFIVFF
jgi:hypothetical protein